MSLARQSDSAADDLGHRPYLVRPRSGLLKEMAFANGECCFAISRIHARSMTGSNFSRPQGVIFDIVWANISDEMHRVGIEPTTQ
jgi:hypothetical protein